METDGVLMTRVGIAPFVFETRVGVGAISRGAAGVGVGGDRLPGTQAALKSPIPMSAATVFDTRDSRRRSASAVDLLKERLPVAEITRNHSQSPPGLQAAQQTR